MIVAVDLESPTPPYEQLRIQFARLIVAGKLRPGERLTPIRQLAADLGISPGTVARAYRELAGVGLVQGRRGGMIVCSPPSQAPSPDQVDEPLRQAAAAYALTAFQLGVAEQQAMTVLGKELGQRQTP